MPCVPLRDSGVLAYLNMRTRMQCTMRSVLLSFRLQHTWLSAGLHVLAMHHLSACSQKLLCSMLLQSGMVTTAATPTVAAKTLVSAPTNAAKRGRFAHGSTDAVQADGSHIALIDWADVLLFAPLSANSLAKLALGLCDNIVTAAARAWPLDQQDKPFVVAPAMNTKMWSHPATQAHIDTLERWGVHVVAPVEKVLACGDLGVGAMASVSTVVEAVRNACSSAAGASGGEHARRTCVC